MEFTFSLEQSQGGSSLGDQNHADNEKHKDRVLALAEYFGMRVHEHEIYTKGKYTYCLLILDAIYNIFTHSFAFIGEAGIWLRSKRLQMGRKGYQEGIGLNVQ